MELINTVAINGLNPLVNAVYRQLRKPCIMLGIILITACSTPTEESGTWVLDCQEDAPESCGYVNEEGAVMIDYGKYPMCFSDTFENYAIVVKQGAGIVAINQQEEVLYQVFVYDNGPDYPSEGYFRIVQDGKMGYADVQTGAVKIKPQFAAAKPFENQYAPVCPNCEVIKDTEHAGWGNGKWGLIDKNGKMVMEPQYDDIREVSDKGEALVIIEGQEEKWVKIQ